MTISYSANVQMRAFEKAEIFASVKVQLDPGDVFETVFRSAYQKVSSEVEKQIDAKKIEREKAAEKDREVYPA